MPSRKYAFQKYAFRSTDGRIRTALRASGGFGAPQSTIHTHEHTRARAHTHTHQGYRLDDLVAELEAVRDRCAALLSVPPRLRAGARRAGVGGPPLLVTEPGRACAFVTSAATAVDRERADRHGRARRRAGAQSAAHTARGPTDKERGGGTRDREIEVG